MWCPICTQSGRQNLSSHDFHLVTMYNAVNSKTKQIHSINSLHETIVQYGGCGVNFCRLQCLRYSCAELGLDFLEFFPELTLFCRMGSGIIRHFPPLVQSGTVCTYSLTSRVSKREIEQKPGKFQLQLLL